MVAMKGIRLKKKKEHQIHINFFCNLYNK